MKYAIIEGGKVVNIAVADSALADNWIEAGAAKIGDSWDGETFIRPTPPPPTAADVAAEWQRRVDIGSVFSVTGVTDPIPVPGRQPYREIVQAKLSAAQLFASQGITDPLMRFRDGANFEHMLTPAQMIDLCIQSMRFYEALSVVYHDMKDGKGDFTGGIPADFAADGYWI